MTDSTGVANRMPHSTTPSNSAMNAFTKLVTSIISPFTTSSDAPSGAEAVRTAVNELEDIAGQDLSATLGEPDITEGGGLFFNNPKVKVPIKDAPYDGAGPLVFDIPEGRDDAEADLNKLLDKFGLDIDSLEELADETVPVEFFGGNAAVVWEKVEDVAEKAADTTDESHPQAADTSPEDPRPTVNVEETTISSDDES